MGSGTQTTPPGPSSQRSGTAQLFRSLLRTHGRRTWKIGRLRFVVLALALAPDWKKVYVKRRGWTLHFGRLNGRWSYGLDRWSS